MTDFFITYNIYRFSMILFKRILYAITIKYFTLILKNDLNYLFTLFTLFLFLVYFKWLFVNYYLRQLINHFIILCTNVCTLYIYKIIERYILAIYNHDNYKTAIFTLQK